MDIIVALIENIFCFQFVFYFRNQLAYLISMLDMALQSVNSQLRILYYFVLTNKLLMCSCSSLVLIVRVGFMSKANNDFLLISYACNICFNQDTTGTAISGS